MSDYVPNSHRYKEEQKAASSGEKRIKNVAIKGPVQTKKKNPVMKFADVFISEDVSNVKSWLLGDVLIPTIKKAIMGALDMTLPGGHVTYGASRQDATPKISYRKFYDDPRDVDRFAQQSRVTSKSRFDYDTIRFDYKSDAEIVLDQLNEAITEYKLVTVNDLYDACRLQAPYTADKFGWTNLSRARVVRTGDGGYVLDLPPARPID